MTRTFAKTIADIDATEQECSVASAHYEDVKKKLDEYKLDLAVLCRGMSHGTLLDICGKWYVVEIDAYKHLLVRRVTPQIVA